MYVNCDNRTVQQILNTQSAECHPLSLGMCLYRHAAYPPKSMFASIKKLANFVKITFWIKKSEEVFGKLTLVNSEFAESEIQSFDLSNELGTFQAT